MLGKYCYYKLNPWYYITNTVSNILLNYFYYFSSNSYEIRFNIRMNLLKLLFYQFQHHNVWINIIYIMQYNDNLKKKNWKFHSIAI